jgi:hypothetical protein
VELAEHLIYTTGGYHDREVCALLNSIYPKQGKPWSVGALEQYRVRESKRSKGPLGSFFANWVDDEISKRRKTASVTSRA